MTKLAILGASGHGKAVADAALLSGWSDIAFFDDRISTSTLAGRWKVLGDTSRLILDLDRFDAVHIGIGDSSVRLAKFDLLSRCGAIFATIIHPSAAVSPFSTIGIGSVILANAVVSVDVCVGPATIINNCASVGHDVILGRGVHVSSGARLAGNVAVGNGTWIGIGSSVRQGIRIGADVMVGAGAVVVNHIPDSSIVVGNPAKPLASKCNRD